MTITRQIFASFTALVLLASPLAGQSANGNRVGLSQRTTSFSPTANSPAVRMEVPRSYWLEGTVIGGVLGLVGGLQLQNGLCNSDSPCSGSDHFFFLIPTLVFAVLGEMIGSTIDKR